MRIEATKVRINDEMDVYLYITFDGADSNDISLSRSYSFDSDHQCMGPASIFHHRGVWPSSDWIEWGGPDRLRSAELQRGKFIAELNGTGGPHPEGWNTVEVAFNLADDKFEELRKALTRCFEGLSLFAEKIAEPGAAPNVGPVTTLLTREPGRGRHR